MQRQLEELDAFRLQALLAKKSELDNAYAALNRERSALESHLKAKYALENGDEVDPHTREIRRR